MVTFFVKFVRICFSLYETFNVSTIENKLMPTDFEKTEHHLMNLAFKQYVRKVLKVERTRQMLVDLVKNENYTSEEMKFMSKYPILWKAVLLKLFESCITEPLSQMTIRISLLRSPDVDVTRTFTGFSDFNAFRSANRNIEYGISGTYNDPLTNQSRPMTVHEIVRGMERGNRSASEEAILGSRPQSKKSKKLKKRAPVTFPKSSSKSYYNYSNPRKFSKSRRF